MTKEQVDKQEAFDFNLFKDEWNRIRPNHRVEKTESYCRWDAEINGKWKVEFKDRSMDRDGNPVSIYRYKDGFYFNCKKIDYIKSILKPGEVAIGVLYFSDAWFTFPITDESVFEKSSDDVKDPLHGEVNEEHYLIKPAQGKVYDYNSKVFGTIYL